MSNSQVPKHTHDSSYAGINHTHDILPPSGHGAVYVRGTRLVTAGNGLTGGGDLTADRTFNVVGGTGVLVNADNIELTAAAIASLAAADTAIQAALLTTNGDIIVRVGGVPARLGVGSEDQVLTVVSGAPAWAAAAGGGGTVDSIVAGTGIAVDDTDPANPIVSATAAGGNSLATEILADSPLAYWKLDEASGNFADSSGNSQTLTATGTPSYQYGSWLPRSTDKYVWFDATTDGGTRADTCGLTSPPTGDWTFELVFITPLYAAANLMRILEIGGTGGEVEAENANIQLSLSRQTDDRAQMDALWEHGAGTNQLVSAVVGRLDIILPKHLCWVKNGTSNTVSFYINGILTDVVTYANEPSGGANARTLLHGETIFTSTPCGMAHAALYGTALSQARVMAHAIAAGFMAPS